METMTLATAVVPEEDSLRGGRVASTRIQGAAVLRSRSRSAVNECGVTCFADPSIPDGLLVLSESLAARAEITTGDHVELEVRPARPLREVVLEALTEDPTEELWRSIRDDRYLLYQCIWTGNDPDSTFIEIGGSEFRVRSIDSGRPNELRQVVSSTAVELFLQGARIGLDMVILADVSGSMSVPDLPTGQRESLGFRVNGRGTGYVARIDALREALEQMLVARLQIQGRESRMALLSFDQYVVQRFPRQAGMAVVDSRTNASTIRDFRDVVSALKPGGTTDLSEAVIRAAELLDRFGKPDNERLVVLVSDGNPFTPKADDAVGEVVSAKDDPVSLVAHLYNDRGIRLHAIGISDLSLYNEYVRRGGAFHESMKADHTLIRELARSGGGDPDRTGGIDVLEDYFRGLGSGLQRFVGRPQGSGAPLRLSTQARAAVRETSQPRSTERRTMLDQFEKDATDLNTACRALLGRDVANWLPFEIRENFSVARRILSDLSVADYQAFSFYIMRLHTLMVERGPGRRGQGRTARGWPQSLDRWYTQLDEVSRRINVMRIAHAHDKRPEDTQGLRQIDELNEAMRHYVGRTLIPPNDGTEWDRLASEILKEACDVVHRCAVELTAKAQANPEAFAQAKRADTSQQVAVTATGGPADYVPRWEGRVRD